MPPFALEDLGVWLERANETSSENILKFRRNGKFTKSVGKLEFSVRGRNKNKIKDFHLLPDSVDVPIVSKELRDDLLSVAEDDIEFAPVEIRLNKENSIERWALHPINVIPCVNLEKSEVRKWIVPHKLILFFDSLAFRPDCLEGHQLVRNANPLSQVIVSERVKKVFEKYQTPNFCFLRDYELKEDV